MDRGDTAVSVAIWLAIVVELQFQLLMNQSHNVAREQFAISLAFAFAFALRIVMHSGR